MSSIQIILLVLGLGTVLLGVAQVFDSSSGKKAMRRLQAVRFRHSDNTSDKVEAQLKKALAQNKSKTYRIAGSNSRLEALRLRLARTGKRWTVNQYFQASFGIAGVVGLLVLIQSEEIGLALLIGTMLGAGLPHLVVGSLIKRRGQAFTSKFPDAIELMVRGLRSGLPVTETLGIVSTEVKGAVAEEFKLIIERIKIGRTMDDALQDTADRLNMPEFSFFCITLAIQRETGGNLAETLANLAEVLRKRAQMKLKIRAMSSESKASAYIVGSLPFIVFGLVWLVNPVYLAGFFVEERLIVAGLVGLVWMGIGVLIMAKMINFEV